VAAFVAAQPQEAVGLDAAPEAGVDLSLMKRGDHYAKRRLTGTAHRPAT
jgi:hypothetical protein